MDDQTPIQAEMQVYVNCIAQIRQRMRAISWAVATAEMLQQDHFVAVETVFLQFRKILELIAFSSLSANRDAYAAVRNNFANDWKAKLILQAVERVNPDFYPVPLVNHGRESGVLQLRPLDAGYLTRAEFVELYDFCAEVLHVRNPWGDSSDVDLRVPVQTWVAKIEALIRFHVVSLAVSKVKWVVDAPVNGPARILAAEPRILKPGDGG